MHDPLRNMILRRADLDALVTTRGVTSRLNGFASPIGGTFGMVRSAGHKKHTGWDLYAAVGTPCSAVAAGEFAFEGTIPGYGLCVIIKLVEKPAMDLARSLRVEHLYAMYAHLSSVSIGKQSVISGAQVALTGNSGNASNTPPHLHLEIRTTKLPRKGDGAAIDPALLLGPHPLVCRADDAERVRRMFGL